MGRLPPSQTLREIISGASVPEMPQTPIGPSALPSRQFIERSNASVPLYEDALGNPTYTNNQSWFETFTDRRLYAQTGGGAGYWGYGWRTPTRMMYDSYIGLEQDPAPDPLWTKEKEKPNFVEERVKFLESQLGDKATILAEDYGPEFLANLASTAVSLDDETARLTYAMDSAFAKRRIADYDAASGWGTYLGTKTLSAVGNYMAVDPITNVTTIASLGAGTLVPAIARSAVVANHLPWLSTSGNMARSWIVANGPTLAKIQFAVAPVDGALSGYAMWDGYNRDASLINGNNAILDDNPYDDIALGAGIGLAGGLIGFGLNIRQLNRDAAIESLATAGLSVPTRESLDYSVRYSSSQSNLLRRLKAAGVRETDDIYREVADPRRLHEMGMRRVDQVDDLVDWVDNNKPTPDELRSYIGNRHVAEHNRLVRFRETIDSVADRHADGWVRDAAGNKVAPNFEKYGDEINAALRQATDDAMNAAGVTANQQRRIYAFMRTRVGMTEHDFHRWVQATNPGKSEFGILTQFINQSLDGERRVIQNNTVGPLTMDQVVPSGTNANRMLHDGIDETAANVRRIIDDENQVMIDGLDALAASGRRNPDVEKIQELLIQLSKDARDVNRQGLRATAGSPQRNIRRMYTADDTKIVNKINRLLRRGEARGEFPPGFVQSVQRNMQARTLENNLLRRRLRDGELAEMLGLMNTNTLAKMDNPRLIDGLYPLRTGFRDGFDEVENIASTNTRLSDDYVQISRLSRTPEVNLETEFSKANAALERSLEDLDAASSAQKMRQLVAPGAGQANLLKKAITGRLPWTSGSRRLTISMVDSNTNQTIRLNVTNKEMFENLFTPESIRKADSSGDWRDLVFKGNLSGVVDDANKAATAAKSNYSRISKSRELGYALADEDWDFARANGLVRSIRGIPFIGNGISDLLSGSLNAGGRFIGWGNDTLVGTRSRLWFNPDSTTGRGLADNIMMLANLIDSPHALRRNLGNLSDDSMHSIQQIRNFNAVAAQRVIKLLQKYANEGNPFQAKDHEALITFFRAVISNDPNFAQINKNLTGKQRILLEALQDFIKPFMHEVQVIRAKHGLDISPRDTATQILLNMLTNPVYERIVAQTGEVRTIINSELTRLHTASLSRLRGTSGIMSVPGQRGPKPRTLDVDRGLLNETYRNLDEVQLARQLNRDISTATTRDDIFAILQPDIADNTPTGFGIARLVNECSDAEITNVRTWEEFVDLLESKKTTQAWNDWVQDQTDSVYSKFNPERNRFNTGRRNSPLTATQMVGVDLMDDKIYTEIAMSPAMGKFMNQNFQDLVSDFANGLGTRMRLQAQLDRNFLGGANRETGIFQILKETRDGFTRQAQETERIQGIKPGTLVNRVNRDMDNLEDMLAHSLGYSVETANRYGIWNTAFRTLNGTVRATVGSFFGLQTALAEVPKAFLLNANRNGFVNAFIDTLDSLINSPAGFAELENLGSGIEQFTRKYSLGVDNEAYMGGIQLRARGNYDPRRPLARAGDILKGNVIDQQGLTRLAAERGSGRITTGAARVVDAGVGLLESVANANTRIGGQQYFTAMARNIAAKGAKKELVRNIELIRTFSRQYNAAIRRLPANATFETKLAILKDISKKNNLEWGMTLRLVKHGLTDEADLKIISQAFKNKSVVRDPGFATEFREYNTQGLRDYIDNFGNRLGDTVPERYQRSDRIMMKMTSYLEEEVNTAVVSATGIGAIPNANFVQRYLGQFSNYVRGFVHQGYLRGAHQSNMMKIIAMGLPVLVGELLYYEGKRLMDIKGYKGKDTYSEAWEETKKEWREQPEVALYRLLTRIPAGGNFQSFLLNHIVNPMEMELFPSIDGGYRPMGRDTPPITQDISHKLIYKGVDAALNTAALSQQTDLQASDIVTRRTNPSEMWSPSLANFKPFETSLEFVNDLTSSNPYIDNYEKWFAFPRGVYGFIPGIRTWQMNTALKTFGLAPAYEQDPRSWRWDQHEARMRKLGY